MRRSVVSHAVALLAALACGTGDGGMTVAQDFGDHSSQALTTRAWQSLERGDISEALAFTAKCREMYAAEAAAQQRELTGFLPAEKGHDAWALNDVGACCFIEGQALEKAGRKADAIAAYNRLVDDYGFAQCWDTRGWFWQPAKAAQDRLDELEFDAALAE
jgi:hypothetical protein